MVKLLNMAAVTALAYVLCDMLHEFGHAAVTLLPLGVRALSISTIGLSTAGSSALVAIAGPLVNFVLASALFLARTPKLSPAWRYFLWLFGTVNLFNAAAYFFYSAILGAGDWATVFNAVAASATWRPVIGVAGAACYVASIVVSSTTLQCLRSSGIVATSNIDRYCTNAFWVGGVVLTVGSAFNQVSHWYILTSGAATGFGAMLGLLAVPVLVRRSNVRGEFLGESLRINLVWGCAGGIALIIFFGVFGPGLRLGS